MDWNNWVPLKANIFLWKAEMNRIPTLTALTSRSIQVGTTVCKLCGHDEETSEHLFTSCFFASQVWWLVANWCKVPPIFAFSTRDLLLVHKVQRLDRRLKKVFHGIMITACWCIWKTRNGVIFSGKTAEATRTLEEIKSLSYLWIKNRSPLKDVSWKNWCNFVL
ncbi:putative reverse transcriptase zinc-binding domain-containing protein [Helianthus annuus]|nr:putative reverse transcriptase zinc-binding domain-containing protein [Helianthus annuus]KAJ0671381.1 putative reverse transcriptase zinc-binding domain-containing protein [Helianthus annuus]